MSFESTKLGENIVGNQRMAWGTYASDSGDTGGDINTGLHSCHNMLLQPKGSAVNSNAPVVNETYPCAGSAMTIVTDANANGYWTAWGD